MRVSLGCFWRGRGWCCGGLVSRGGLGGGLEGLGGGGGGCWGGGGGGGGGVLRGGRRGKRRGKGWKFFFLCFFRQMCAQPFLPPPHPHPLPLQKHPSDTL